LLTYVGDEENGNVFILECMTPTSNFGEQVQGFIKGEVLFLYFKIFVP
jgi:hypothetical protein